MLNNMTHTTLTRKNTKKARVKKDYVSPRIQVASIYSSLLQNSAIRDDVELFNLLAGVKAPGATDEGY